MSPKRRIPLLTLLILSLWCGAAFAGNTLYQYSTIDALLAGVYDGRLTMGRLLEHGDFGLGTLNGLDGELVVLDGTAYHAAAGGKVDVVADQAMTPFACVALFKPEAELALGRIDGLEALNAAVAAGLPSKNVFWAIRIDGTFDRVRTRAIPRQTPPYVPLAEAAKQQVVVESSGPGTLVGIYSPPFAKGMGVPGFHWHFLTRDRTGGGHVLDCALAPATARLDGLRAFSMDLPRSQAFDALNLNDDRSKALNAVEKDAPKKE